MSINDTKETQVEEFLIETCNYEKLLAVKINCKLKFDNHVNNLCKKR